MSNTNIVPIPESYRTLLRTLNPCANTHKIRDWGFGLEYSNYLQINL